MRKDLISLVGTAAAESDTKNKVDRGDSRMTLQKINTVVQIKQAPASARGVRLGEEKEKFSRTVLCL